MLNFRSIISLLLSLLIHGSVAAYFLIHDFKQEPLKPKKFTMQVAMFKVAPAPMVKTPATPIVELEMPKPALIPPLEKDIKQQKTPVLKPPKEIIIKPVVKKIAVIKPKPPVKVKLKKKVVQKNNVTKKKSRKPNKLARKKIAKPKAIVRKKPKAKPRAKVVIAPKRKVIAEKPDVKHTPQVRKATVKRAGRQVTPTRRVTTQTTRKKPEKPAQVVKKVIPVRKPKAAFNPQLEQQYKQSVRQKIEQKKKYPRRAKRMRKQGVVKIGFSISQNGTILNLRIATSSGVKALDQAALKAVKRVGQFSAIPAGIGKQSLNYVIPIAYRLR